MCNNFSSVEAAKVLRINKNTVTQWTSFCWKVMSSYIEKNFKKLGGENTVVEIDEALFCRRKNHKGRITKGTWVLGGFERDGGCFFVPFANRNT